MLSKHDRKKADQDKEKEISLAIEANEVQQKLVFYVEESNRIAKEANNKASEANNIAAGSKKAAWSAIFISILIPIITYVLKKIGWL